MTKLTRLIVLLAGAGLLIRCSSSRQSSTLYSDSYDPAKNKTSVVIFPYGQTVIPGKWTKTGYNKISRQYFFKNDDSVIFAVALNYWDKYGFYKAEMTPGEFVKAFYEWDAGYLKEQLKAETRLIKEDKERNFIIWGLEKAPDIDGCFLFGLKNKTVYNIYVDTGKWNETEKIALLEKIYNE